jgi:hypothetical protein
MIDCVRTRLGGIHSLAHESREHKKKIREVQKQLSWMETTKQDRASKAAQAAARSSRDA